MWEDRATQHHAHLMENITSGAPALEKALRTMLAGGMSREQAMGMIDRMVKQQALMLAADDIF